MTILRYGQRLSILVSVKGHTFDRSAFGALFDEMPGIAAAIVDQPASARLMTPAGMAGFDAVVLYDMPGIDFLARGGPAFVDPSPTEKAGFLAMLDAGIPVVALHHAIAGWQTWPEYAEILGGRFLYRPATLRGRECPDSGYLPDAEYTARAAGPGHPILAGLPQQIPFKDTLFLYEVFEGDVNPLLRADHSFGDEGFFSTKEALAGRMYSNADWAHPPGSDLIGWTKRARNAPLVYLQPGRGVETCANPHYRQLVRNAILWACASEQRALSTSRKVRT
ncbi:MAG: ThuA domain-containing protein [Usitatibacteraceae bacterium]